MRTPRITPTTYRHVTVVAALLLAVIIVTGGAVRLTDSGLGCPSWPNCSAGRLTAHSASDAHQWIESVNRMFTGLVSVAVIVAVLGSLARVPRRRDLTLLSVGLVGGVVAQAVLGGLTVLFDLKPGFVMAHFLVSIVLLTNALVLVKRASIPDSAMAGPARAVVGHRSLVLGRCLLVLAGMVLVAGTIVTGAGPHSGGGKKHAVARLDIAVPTAARIHGIVAMTFLVCVVAFVWVLGRERAPRSAIRATTLLLVVLVLQAVVGYVQYFNDIPAWLVAIHVAGATAVWSATVWVYLGLAGHGSPGRAAAQPAATPV